MSLPLTVYKPFEGNTKEEWNAHVPKRSKFLLCHNCGWNAHEQLHSCYSGRVKIMCNSSRGIWFIGDDYVLKERAILEHGRASHMGPDVEVSRFLAENSTIPVAKYLHHWKDSKSHFSIAERVPGMNLTQSGPILTRDQIRGVAREVVEYLKELRKFTSPKIQTPSGLPVRDRVLGSARKVQFVTDDVQEWWTRTKPRFKRVQIERWRDIIEDEYPVKGPYVLTHGDLDGSNIMVADGHVSAIIDWETAGYLPEWWEPVATELSMPPLWIHFFEEEWKLQIGPWPDKEVLFARTYKNFFVDYNFQRLEPPRFYDQDAYMQCPNYSRYITESLEGFEETMRERERQKRRDAAKEIAASEALKKLSLEEKEIVKD
ncbi:hypothetical protein BGAL_0009g00550 [Botrytis galanthina]|uniref:Aminoglycoside phosphotransferase domain-containing protein n=1 Tax=Botrytis galanthina TaxID=278940 RepID=A0A4S8RFN0_9HELO|nr:hypothetical protein BGAL_0009g00550 [Botrytis galanthina]